MNSIEAISVDTPQPNEEENDFSEVKQKQKKKAEKIKKALSNRGVIYLSRFPSGMNWKTLKGSFQQFGTITRTHYQIRGKRKTPQQEEEAKQKRKNQLIGQVWLEFESKKQAMKAAALNGTPLGGKSKHRAEMWNIKYLSGFSFDSLIRTSVIAKAEKKS